SGLFLADRTQVTIYAGLGTFQSVGHIFYSALAQGNALAVQCADGLNAFFGIETVRPHVSAVQLPKPRLGSHTVNCVVEALCRSKTVCNRIILLKIAINKIIGVADPQ